MTLQTMQTEKNESKTHTKMLACISKHTHSHSQGSLWDHSWGFMQVGIFAK